VIRLSKRSDYGLMAIRHLAAAPNGTYLSAREIATKYGIPPALMAKLLQKLTQGGLVASHHGTKGGYQIARRPSEITLWDVVRAIEGPVCFIECLDPEKDDCPQDATCTVRGPLKTVHRKITAVLEGTTVTDL
jgi:Rrf2 family protein